jgi:hypothetical protein
MKHARFVLMLWCTALCVSQTDAQWVQIGLPGRDVGEIAAGGSELYAITNDSGSAFRSSDAGKSWVQIRASQTRHIAVAPDGIVYMAMSEVWPQQDSLSRSTDRGDSWTGLYPYDKMPKGLIASVAVGPNGTVFCGVNSFGASPAIGVSTDGGLSWISPGGDTTGGLGYAFHGDSVITVTEYYLLEEPKGGFALSSDCGLTWQHGDLWPRFSGLFAWCSNGNVLWSAIGGWLHFPGTVRIIPTLSALIALQRGGVLAGSDGTGIYLFSDNGDSLGTVNEGLTDLHIHAFASDSVGYLYAGTDAGIWRRPLSEITTSVRPVTAEMPHQTMMYQNYPNPFNPSTTIRYGLPKRSHVSLTVYNTLGQRVAILQDGEQEAGYHEIQFDASDLASGVYLYRLQAGDFVQSRKLVLLR